MGKLNRSIAVVGAADLTKEQIELVTKLEECCNQKTVITDWSVGAVCGYQEDGTAWIGSTQANTDYVEKVKLFATDNTLEISNGDYTIWVNASNVTIDEIDVGQGMTNRIVIAGDSNIVWEDFEESTVYKTKADGTIGQATYVAREGGGSTSTVIHDECMLTVVGPNTPDEAYILMVR